MSSLCVELNAFRVWGEEVSSKNLYSPQVKAVNQYLKKIVDSIPPAFLGKSFKIKFTAKGAFLESEGREVSLPKTRELRKVLEAVRYSQNVGVLPKAPKRPSDFSKDVSRQKVIGVRDASLAGVNNSQLLADGMQVVDNSASLARSILYATPGVKKEHPILQQLGYYSGIFWTIFAIREIKKGKEAYARAQLIGDTEGVRRSRIRIASGGLVSTGSFTSVLANVVCGAASFGLFAFSKALFGLGSLIAISSSSLGILRCHEFDRKIQEYMKNPKIPEEKRLIGVLNFLKESIVVTPEEAAVLKHKIERKHSRASSDEIKELLRIEIEHLTETKVKFMKRRTSSKSLSLILDGDKNIQSVDAILALLNSSETKKEGALQAWSLISQIRKENNTKKTLYFLGFLAATVSLVALSALMFFSAGALPFILYGISATIYLVVAIYMKIGQAINYKKKQEITNGST